MVVNGIDIVPRSLLESKKVHSILGEPTCLRWKLPLVPNQIRSVGLSVSCSGMGVKQGILKESGLKIRNKPRGVGNISSILQEERLKTFGDIDIDHIMNFELMREV